jgi:serine/threonine protein kinase
MMLASNEGLIKSYTKFTRIFPGSIISTGLEGHILELNLTEGQARRAPCESASKARRKKNARFLTNIIIFNFQNSMQKFSSGADFLVSPKSTGLTPKRQNPLSPLFLKKPKTPGSHFSRNLFNTINHLKRVSPSSSSNRPKLYSSRTNGKPPALALKPTNTPLNAENIFTTEAKSSVLNFRRLSTPCPELKKAEGTSNLSEKYVIGSQIGKGTYAIVRKATHKKTGILYAVKTYQKVKLLEPHRRRNLNREISILKKLIHEVIDETNEIHLILDYAKGVPLYQFIKRKAARKVNESEAKYLFRQIVEGLGYCHDMDIAHRDIKLENIIVDTDRKVKIIDFGFATCFAEKSKMFCGTPSYMAPEIVNKEEYRGCSADIWALGVLLYAMLMGSFPFRGSNDRDLYRKILESDLHFSDSLSASGRDLLNLLFNKNPDKRPSCKEILSHKWLSTPRTNLLPAPDFSDLSCDTFTSTIYNQKSSDQRSSRLRSQSPIINMPSSTRTFDFRSGNHLNVYNLFSNKENEL